jgi:glyoxylase-like metal-dependent hydrolase (beta-lactamase superfamily II)
LTLSIVSLFPQKITPVTSPSAEPKLPRPLFAAAAPAIDAFPPNRETLGGTAYLLTDPSGSILIDTPAWTPENQHFLANLASPVRWLFITQRGGIGQHLLAIQQTLQCQVLIQEQEAYLIPEITTTTFHQTYDLTPTIVALWTPGHSPGASCLYTPSHGGILFSGRHLIPDRQGHPVPLRTAKTFHWPRQLRSITALVDRFSTDNLQHICPGASIGWLRGAMTIDNAYAQLQQLELSQLAQAPIGLSPH